MRKISLILLFLVSCNDRSTALRQVELLNETHSKQWRLEETDYFINFGDNFRFENNGFGKEGQKTYVIVAKDSASNMLVSIEIDEGQQLLDRGVNWGTIIDTLESTLLKRKVFWKVYKSQTKSYVAELSSGKIWVNVFSKDQKGIDSLISIVATLTKK
jgi:hypothetical protein